MSEALLKNNLNAINISANLDIVNQIINDVMASKTNISKLRTVLKFNESLKNTVGNQCLDCTQCKTCLDNEVKISSNVTFLKKIAD